MRDVPAAQPGGTSLLLRPGDWALPYLNGPRSLELPLEIRVERDGRGLVIQLFGELDSASCAAFEQRLASARQWSSSWLIVDLSGLDLVDASGIRALMKLARREPRLLLLRGPQSVHRSFVDMGVDELLPFID